MATSPGMDTRRVLRYEIEVKGMLEESWLDWFDGEILSLEGKQATPGFTNTVLMAAVADQPALRGVLNRLWDLNLVLIAVRLVAPESPSRAGECVL